MRASINEIYNNTILHHDGKCLDSVIEVPHDLLEEEIWTLIYVGLDVGYILLHLLVEWV